MKKILLTLFLLSGCGGGGNGTEDQQTVVTPTPTPTPTNPDAGTVLETTCEGTTLIETIADGNGGSTTEETTNSTQCGYVAPPTEGTVLDEFCEDTTKITITADGNGGEVRSEEEKSEDCGYEPPLAEGTPIGDSYCAGTLTSEEYDPLFENINHLLPEDRLQDYADGEDGVYTDRTVHLDQSCFVQMEKPDDCPTTGTDTGDSRFEYLTCDGVKQKSPVSFPYTPREQHAGRAIIDMLVVVDTALTEEDRDGMTVEEFVDHQVLISNHMYMVSGTYTLVRVAGIKMVDVAAGDLYRQYAAFFNGRYEFNGLSDWQREAGADIAFLFKKKPENAIACGVASLDATRGIDKTRGITQCFHNTTFQSTSTTRYYERAYETFAHEIGHLLGAQHEWSDADSPGLFEYSYGYNLPGYNPQDDNPDYEGIHGGYGTIMSYADLATGRFSDYTVSCMYPEEAGEYAGQSVQLGTTGGCFCLDPPEEQPMPTNNAEGIARTRWIMSQLHEAEHGLQFSPAGKMYMDGLIFEDDDTQICLF